MSSKVNTDQKWEPMHEHVSHVKQLGENKWLLENIRNFNYQPNNNTTYRWASKEIDISDIEKTFLYVAPLGQFGSHGNLFAHTTLGFFFKDESNIIYTVEARQGLGADFRLKGNKDNIRLFTTHNNLLTFRHNVRRRGFSRYPLTAEIDTQKQLLTACIDDLQNHRNAHDKYNALTNQCTTALMKVMNKALEKPIPWHPSWHVSRFLPSFLASRNLINLSQKEDF